MPFEVSGMDAVIAAFARREGRAEAAVKKAVKAGGEYLAERLSEAAPKDTEALANSIKPGPVKYSAAEGYYCEVKPVGNHPKTGEPLAKIGNILEHGRSYGRTHKAGIGWFHPTVKLEEGEAVNVIGEAFDKEMEG